MSKIQKELKKMQDLAYRDFNAKLIPNVDVSTMIGVRSPMLKRYAKEISKDEKTKNDFLKSLPHVYFDEYMLHIHIINLEKDLEIAFKEVNKLLPYVDNWAVCDSLCPNIFKKYPDEVYACILKWLTSEHVYTKRFAIGLLLSNYLDEHFKEEHLRLVSQLNSDDYYLDMMIAWYFSIALIKQWNCTLPYFTNPTMKPWVINKAISKGIDSYRLSKEQKDYLRSLKIKK
ncbi:DNA alkylation repair protein [Erysipelotrichaceae bacterium OH741_COT-311]|nr:DNA alkylation repair protein [Erysipelotrichaceae bacterium OH741_COT-311]